jgi:uncharacterized metal-binding protein
MYSLEFRVCNTIVLLKVNNICKSYSQHNYRTVQISAKLQILKEQQSRLQDITKLTERSYYFCL